MRVFVCEFVTGGGFVDRDLPSGLCREGDMMLRALVKDLAALPGVAVVAARDRRLPDPALPARIAWLDPGCEPWRAWAAHVAEAHAVWPIAPETDGVLERLSALVRAAGRGLLGSTPEAVRVAASKRATAALLAAQGLPVLPTRPLPEALADGLPAGPAGWVVKPDDGAGSEDTFVWDGADGAAALAAWAARRDDVGRFVVQPYRPGSAASLTLLCRDGRAALLACNTQDVRHEGDRLRYHGGIVGGSEAQRARYAPLATGVAAAIPGLWGLVGVDLVDGPEGPVIVEVNPRLTTTYVGLGAALGVNPAGLVLRLADGAGTELPEPGPVSPHRVSVHDGPA